MKTAIDPHRLPNRIRVEKLINRKQSIPAVTIYALGAIGLVSQALLAQTAEQQSRLDALTTLFENANVIGKPGIVECTLSGGEKSLCFSITTGAAPSNHATGPYCPRTIDSPPEASGTWFIDNEVTAADGQFIQNLAVIYQDDEWKMYNPDTGEVILVEGELGCAVAGDPSSAADYKNYCVECEIAYLDDALSETYVIPLIPVPIDGHGARIGPSPGVGLAFNGVKLDAPAPMHMIEGNHTLGLMDGCTGHVNPYAGYHYHALVGCEPKVAASLKGHAPQVAVAMDGYDIYNTQGDLFNDELDAYRGHEAEGLGYHYHVDAAGTNQFIGCFRAQYGCTTADASTECDASASRRRPPRGGLPPDGPPRESSPGNGLPPQRPPPD